MVELSDALEGGYQEAKVGTAEAGEIASLPSIVYTKIFHSQWGNGDTLQVWHGIEGRLGRALFADGAYYGGCGECYLLSLVTVPVGTPLVGWNLD